MAQTTSEIGHAFAVESEKYVQQAIARGEPASGMALALAFLSVRYEIRAIREAYELRNPGPQTVHQ